MFSAGKEHTHAHTHAYTHLLKHACAHTHTHTLYTDCTHTANTVFSGLGLSTGVKSSSVSHIAVVVLVGLWRTHSDTATQRAAHPDTAYIAL